MKRSLLFIMLAGFALFARGQSKMYHAFKVDIMGGVAIPSGNGNGSTTGVAFTIEPHYRLSDDVAIGLRYSGYAVASDSEEGGLYSLGPTLDYYLNKGEFRPFIGGGFGFSSRFNINVNSEGNISVADPNKTEFAAFPRVGFESGHFRMSAEYNLIGNDGSYLAFQIGFFFGGGKK